jgi:dephospho-CoA kinase
MTTAARKKDKLLVIGHARHGKDTVCEILRDKYGFSFKSSSEFCAEKVVFPQLAEKYGYSTVAECFEDRVNHREEWFNIIREYNTPDKGRLGREIFSQYDIYCGLRNVEEAMALHRIYDVVAWVDAKLRQPLESETSITLNSDHADYVIDNNGTLGDLEAEVAEFIEWLS